MFRMSFSLVTPTNASAGRINPKALGLFNCAVGMLLFFTMLAIALATSSSGVALEPVQTPVAATLFPDGAAVYSSVMTCLSLCSARCSAAHLYESSCSQLNAPLNLASSDIKYLTSAIWRSTFFKLYVTGSDRAVVPIASGGTG